MCSLDGSPNSAPASASAIAFCATGKTGLGHLRRITNIAAALRRQAPEAALTLVTNAPVAGLSPDERKLFRREIIAPREAMARQLARFDHSLVVVDTALMPEVGYLPASTCLVLREVVDEKLGVFRLPAGRRWDAVIVPAPADAWVPDVAIVGAEHIRNVGWIYRAAPVTHAAVLPPRTDKRRILVAFGGGASEELAAGLRAAAHSLVAHLKANTTVAFEIVQVLGPRARPADRMQHADAVVDVGANLHLAFAEADLVLTSVGYNSTLELAATTTPGVLLPIACTYDDQWRRAQWWEKHIGCAYDPAAIERAVGFMAGVINTGQRRPAYDPGPSGADLAAEHLIRLAGEGFRKPVFAKSFKPGCRLLPEVAAAASRELFVQGVGTLPQMADQVRQQQTSVRLGGISGRQRLLALGPKRHSWECAQWSTQIGSMLRPLASLHRASLDGLAIEVFDAFDRIEPRLRAVEHVQPRAAGSLARERLLSLAQRVRQQLARLTSDAGETGLVPIHGDFHAGQLMFEAPSDEPWIVDLDDMALGAPEADLANFAAHLATSPDLFGGPPREGFRAIAAVVMSQYRRVSDDQIDSASFEAYGAAALLRRLLKHIEQGRMGPDWSSTLDAVADCLMRCGSPGIEADDFPKRVVSGNGFLRDPDETAAGARPHAQ